MKDDSIQKGILEKVTSLYIFIMLLLYPLLVDKTGYFKILEFKWHSYLIITITYFLVMTCMILYFLLFQKINVFKTIKLKKIHYLAFSFLLILFISTIFSPYRNSHNLLVGVGRGEGLLVSSLYALSFIFITLFGKFKKRYILYFSILSIMLNAIAFLQYLGLNPFNMYQDGIGTHNVSFMTTIGNIDFISALYTILITISMGSFIILDNKRHENIIHLISVFLGFFIMSLINVQSGKLALICVLILCFPFLVFSSERLRKFLISISFIIFAYALNIIINPEYHYDLGSLDFYFQFNIIVLIMIMLSVAILFLSTKLKKIYYNILDKKKYYKYYYIIILVCFILGLVGLYFINFNSGFLYEIHELLHGNFNDEFGTYRVFLWKRTLKMFNQYPIIGSGPDTFALRFMAKYTIDVMSIGPLSINDTAANVYLTMLINLGVIGLINYLLFLFIQIKDGIKKANNYSFILLIAIIAYMISDFFNLSVVIVTPIFWILMSIHYLCINDSEIMIDKVVI